MARGGKRPGAGRKKGQVSEQTATRKAYQTAALASGISPLDYMLQILRDESQEQSARFAAAKEAAPYVHNRLASVEHKADKDSPFEMVTRIELVAPAHVHRSN